MMRLVVETDLTLTCHMMMIFRSVPGLPIPVPNVTLEYVCIVQNATVKMIETNTMCYTLNESIWRRWVWMDRATEEPGGSNNDRIFFMEYPLLFLNYLYITFPLTQQETVTTSTSS